MSFTDLRDGTLCRRTYKRCERARFECLSIPCFMRSYYTALSSMEERFHFPFGIEVSGHE